MENSHKVAVVVWEDHWFTDEDLTPEGVVDMLAPILRVTVGFVAGENEQWLALAATRDPAQPQTDNKLTYCDITFIAKKLIVDSEYYTSYV